MTKLHTQNWAQLDFLINNFYEIVEYKRGRGIYGDRIILKRPKSAESIFGEPSRLYEFYYLDANAVKELPRTIMEKIRFITRLVINPTDMNVLCNFEDAGKEPNEWALELKTKFQQLNTLDFAELNSALIEKYKELNSTFITNLNKHREKQYFLASSEGFNFMTKEYVDEQLSRI